MAYLDPETLTCPSCRKSGDLVWVVGEGPNTKPGQAPDYVDVQEAGDWLVETANTAPNWEGAVVCPQCNSEVLRRP